MNRNVCKLSSYFLKRNYPFHIIDNAFQKVRALPRDMALTETVKSVKKLVPYVITYNPSLPNIGEIINKYWGLLALSEKQSVKYVFQHKPILAFKRPQNLGDILIHSSTSETFLHKQDLNCTSENVIYLITCKKCNAQYVGQTHQKVSKRMNSHRFDILHYPESITNVSVHFNENSHSVDNFSFTPIDKVENEWPCLLKETYWMHRLKTLSPNGMVTKVLYQIPKT